MAQERAEPTDIPNCDLRTHGLQQTPSHFWESLLLLRRLRRVSAASEGSHAIEQFFFMARTKEQINSYAREYDRKARAARIDGYTYVYYLPEEHYVGITNDVVRRMRVHRHKGKIVDDYEIIARFERAVDAHSLETMFHQRNYNGFKI